MVENNQRLFGVLLELSSELFALCDKSGCLLSWSSALEEYIEESELRQITLHLPEGGAAELVLEDNKRLTYNILWRDSDHLIVRLQEILPTDELEYHKQRMQTLGELAGGIAHDFNNILAGVLGHVTYLRNILPSTGDHVESVEAISEGARKASEMTKQILNFARLGSHTAPQPVSLKSFVEKSALLLKGALAPAQEMELQLGDPQYSPLISANEGKLMQVLANLCMNARDALGGAGKIIVRIGRFGDDEAYLSVEDNGCGIPPAVLNRIFDPFFSTKGSNGTGLGLSTSHAIIREFHGRIEVESEVGVGTRVTVYFPAQKTDDAESQQSLSESNNEEDTARGSGELVLVVDDDPAVRRVITMSLEHLGYTVHSASGGEDALEWYERHYNDVELVMLDMLMPGMPGEEVFTELQKINDKVRVIVMSGYSSQSAVNSILDNGGLAFIHKPFSIEELSEQISECLCVEV